MPAELFFPGIRTCRCGVQFWLACTLCRVDSKDRVTYQICLEGSNTDKMMMMSCLTSSFYSPPT